MTSPPYDIYHVKTISSTLYPNLKQIVFLLYSCQGDAFPNPIDISPICRDNVCSILYTQAVELSGGQGSIGPPPPPSPVL